MSQAIIGTDLLTWFHYFQHNKGVVALNRLFPLPTQSISVFILIDSAHVPHLINHVISSAYENMSCTHIEKVKKVCHRHPGKEAYVRTNLLKTSTRPEIVIKVRTATINVPLRVPLFLSSATFFSLLQTSSTIFILHVLVGETGVTMTQYPQQKLSSFFWPTFDVFIR
jgi:hypothetical protein